MKSIMFLAAFVLGLASLPARADIAATRCDCSTENLWNAKALSVGGEGYLYSFSSRKLRKFRVERDGGGTDPLKAGGEELASSSPTSDDVVTGGEGHVVWLSVEPRYQNYFDDMLAVRDHFAQPLSGIGIVYELPSNATDSRGNPVGGYNAYDVVNSTANSNRLADYLNERRQDIMGRNVLGEISDKFANLLQAIDKVVTQGELLKVTVTVKFSDGSEVKFTITAQNNGAAERVRGSGKDSNQNDVLEEITNTSGGYYDVNPQDFDGFFNNMRRLGVRIVRASGTRTVRYSCTWNAPRLTCSMM